MLTREPLLRVGIVEGRTSIAGSFGGPFEDQLGGVLQGDFTCALVPAGWSFTCGGHTVTYAIGDVRFTPTSVASVVRLEDVTIGVNFHWERREPQVFHGALRLHAVPGKGITAINEVPLEEYLKSVISSEMSATAPAASAAGACHHIPQLARGNA